MFTDTNLAKLYPAMVGTQSSTNTLLSLLNNLPGMVYRCRDDPDWTMEFISSGCLDLTGYSSADLIRNKVISYGSLIHPDDRQRIWVELQSSLQHNTSYEIVYRIKTRQGKEKWVRALGRGTVDTVKQCFVLEGFIADVTDQIRIERQLQLQTSRMQALRKIDMAISASFDLSLTLNILLEQITNQLNVDAADILLYSPYTHTLGFAAERGFTTNALKHTNLRLGESFAGQAAISRQVVHIPDLNQSLGQFTQSPFLINEGFISYFGVPLIAKGQIKGVLEIFHRSKLQATVDWLEFLEAVAGQAAIALDNATLFNELQHSNAELAKSYDATLEGWVKALELRDRETEGHAQRVIWMTMELAERMGLDSENLPHIRRGALLHDIGKMGVPDSILLKPGPLDKDEWKVMKQHPVYAYQWLSPISYLGPALQIPYYHHEKWDGSGYPNGLKGEQIPLPARIFAVADVWDALTSDRPYRSAWTEIEADDYIREEAGKHFDPQVVDYFFKYKEYLM
jgi:PAS domain S-box-containing protein